MEYVPVTMIHNDLHKAPKHSIPTGFLARNFQPGDNLTWARIEHSAKEFPDVNQALDGFQKEFGGHQEELRERCFFLTTAQGEPIGTATGWYNDTFADQRVGRLHWVAIRQSYQGRKLGKPLVSLAIECMKRFHDKAYLTSQTTSFKAIGMYLDFGFQPYIVSDTCEKAWDLLAKKLQFPNGSGFVNGYKGV